MSVGMSCRANLRVSLAVQLTDRITAQNSGQSSSEEGRFRTVISRAQASLNSGTLMAAWRAFSSIRFRFSYEVICSPKMSTIVLLKALFVGPGGVELTLMPWVSRCARNLSAFGVPL